MDWKPEMDELRRREAFAEALGGAERVKRQHDGGRLTIRERIARLVDEGSFHEIGTATGVGAYDEAGELKDFAPANFVLGRATLDGRRVVIAGDDFTVRGGANDAGILEKALASERMARDLRLPIVRLVDGTGGGGSVKNIEMKGHTLLPGYDGRKWVYMLQNLSLDILRLQSAGVQSVMNDVNSVTQEARALMREIGHVLGAADELRGMRESSRENG